MPSAACQDIMNVIVSCPIRRSPSVIMNVSIQEYCALDRFFNVAQWTTMTPLSVRF